jgi:hypothetical protein
MACAALTAKRAGRGVRKREWREAPIFRPCEKGQICVGVVELTVSRAAFAVAKELSKN